MESNIRAALLCMSGSVSLRERLVHFQKKKIISFTLFESSFLFCFGYFQYSG